MQECATKLALALLGHEEPRFFIVVGARHCEELGFFMATFLIFFFWFNCKKSG
jgi:hypothetical protein